MNKTPHARPSVTRGASFAATEMIAGCPKSRFAADFQARTARRNFGRPGQIGCACATAANSIPSTATRRSAARIVLGC